MSSQKIRPRRRAKKYKVECSRLTLRHLKGGKDPGNFCPTIYSSLTFIFLVNSGNFLLKSSAKYVALNEIDEMIAGTWHLFQ